MSKKLRVIVLKDGDLWLAQGIEHDICVQATTLPALWDRFDFAVRSQIDLSKIPSAPDRFHAMWDSRGGDITPPPLGSEPDSEEDSCISYGLAA